MRKDGTRFYCSGVTTRLGEGAGLGFAKIARDLTGQQRAADALREAHDELEERCAADDASSRHRSRRSSRPRSVHVVNLLRKLVTAQEDERGRIARDLHDQLGQQLTALRLALERCSRRDSDDGRRRRRRPRARI